MRISDWSSDVCSSDLADHLYAVDIFGDDILHVPIDAGKQRRINAPAVDQDEQLVGEVLRLGISAQPPGGDGCAAGAASQHLQVRCEPQYARKIGRENVCNSHY